MSAANDDPTPFEREIDAVSRFNPASVLERTPLESAFLDLPSPTEYVCGCGKKRFAPCSTCSAQYQREQREHR